MGLQDDMKTLLAMDAQAQKETFTPSHPFSPDVVAWAEDMVKHYSDGYITPMVGERVKAARQILAAVGRW